MNCSSCGLQLPPQTANCPRCGAATPYYYANTGTTSYDATFVSTPHPGGQQTPPSQYGAPPYEPTVLAPAGSPVYGAEPQNPYSASPYAPYSSLPLTPTPPVPPPVPRSGNRVGIIVGVVVLVLVVIGGGVFAVLQYSAARNAAAAAAAAATATAHATATAIVALQNPYTHSGTLALSDPLSDNSKGYGWSEDAPNCAFINGTYHAVASDVRYSDYCLAQVTTFSDFAFEVQMQIIKGDDGGLVFRVTRFSTFSAGNNLYAFYINQNGSYYLNRQDGTSFPVVAGGSNPAIHRGLNQTNLIAVVAQGSTILLYVNHQLITRVTDSTYTSGELGVFVAPYNQPTEVVFSNAKVWRL